MDEIIRILKDVKITVHFVGILGSGCYPLAKLLRARGYSVTGSDLSAVGDYIDECGIRIEHSPLFLTQGVGLVVYSLAVPECSPEILDAQRRGIPLVSRAQLLGALMYPYPVRISVSGSHGKSTTTALIEHILSTDGRLHTAVSGATLASGDAFTDGGGNIFLAEACEYKNSFLSLCPTHQLISSVELDHTDYFASIDHIRSSFLRAAEAADTVIINADDPVASGIAAELSGGSEGEKTHTPPHYSTENGRAVPKNVITYGKSPSALYRFHTVKRHGEYTTLSLTHKDRTIDLCTPLIGEYNLYNLSAAVAIADTLGVGEDSIRRAVFSFRGIDRRASIIGRIGTTPIYYDYAHHPTEIGALIGALKERHGTVAVIFRPHTYSRTASLWDEFVRVLSMADTVILLDIFAAREAPMDDISSERLARCIKGAVYCSSADDAAMIASGERVGAIALVGAGDVEAVRSHLIGLSKNTL